MRTTAERRGRRTLDEGRAARALRSTLLTRYERSGGELRTPSSIAEVIGSVDGNGSDRFNFRQTVWLYPGVPMRATPRFTKAAEVLAVNMLSLVFTERDYQALRGKTSARAVRLARSFYRDCLSDLPTEGWCIPLETIREWMDALPRELANKNANRAGPR